MSHVTYTYDEKETQVPSSTIFSYMKKNLIVLSAKKAILMGKAQIFDNCQFDFFLEVHKHYLHPIVNWKAVF